MLAAAILEFGTEALQQKVLVKGGQAARLSGVIRSRLDSQVLSAQVQSTRRRLSSCPVLQLEVEGVGPVARFPA